MTKKPAQKKAARTTAPKARIGFVGVGRMGANMARHLNDLKYKVTAVYDVNEAAADDLAKELCATACRKLADVTANADIIFTVVTNDDAMKSIFLSKGDSLLKGAEGRTFVNCATLSPGAIRRASGMLRAPDRRMSSELITNTAAAVSKSFSFFFETDVTSAFSSSARDRLSKTAISRFTDSSIIS